MSNQIGHKSQEVPKTLEVFQARKTPASSETTETTSVLRAAWSHTPATIPCSGSTRTSSLPVPQYHPAAFKQFFFQCYLIFRCIPAGFGTPSLQPGPRTAAQATNSAQTPRQLQARVICGGSDGASLGRQQRTAQRCADLHCATVVTQGVPASLPFPVF